MHLAFYLNIIYLDNVLRDKILAFSRVEKKILILTLDIFLIAVSMAAAFSFRVGIERWIAEYLSVYFNSCLLAIIIALPIYMRMGLYRVVLRYMGPQVSFTILRASFLVFIFFAAVESIFDLNVPRSIPVLYWLISSLLLGLSRYVVKYWLTGYRLSDIILSTLAYKKTIIRSQQGKPVAIYGAGSAGVQLVEVLEHTKEYRPVAFLDDNMALKGRVVRGKSVYHSSQLNMLLSDTGVEEFLLALPSASRKRRTEIVNSLESTGLPIKSMS